MEYVKFIPWKGEEYEKGFNGKKLLILGDSHYCATEESKGGKKCDALGKCAYECMDKDCFSMTNSFLRDEYLPYREDATKYIYYTNEKGEIKKRSTKHLQTLLNFENNVFNYTPSPSEGIDFWKRVIFYNYKQHSQPQSGEARSTSKEEKEEYRKAFNEILEEYQPDCIIVWCKSLFTDDWLPDGADEFPDYTLKVEDKGEVYDTPVRTFKLKGGKYIRALITHHPWRCRGEKCHSKWYALITKFLKLE